MFLKKIYKFLKYARRVSQYMHFWTYLREPRNWLANKAENKRLNNNVLWFKTKQKKEQQQWQ